MQHDERCRLHPPVVVTSLGPEILIERLAAEVDRIQKLSGSGQKPGNSSYEWLRKRGHVIGKVKE